MLLNPSDMPKLGVPAPIPNAENIDIAALLNATRFHGQAREGAL
ncbi:hypothetical protein DAD186_20320 [Dermabacter vaginalis]|uniref:Uncharacterized protein n=1 Tax=Dermabacter vaginalis TaxID=1630135 RepID=A0A1B0ZL31_9MICO|nr:hypothetical protein DAD186_20320 [Dermabacter vaginalis]